MSSQAVPYEACHAGYNVDNATIAPRMRQAQMSSDVIIVLLFGADKAPRVLSSIAQPLSFHL